MSKYLKDIIQAYELLNKINSVIGLDKHTLLVTWGWGSRLRFRSLASMNFVWELGGAGRAAFPFPPCPARYLALVRPHPHPVDTLVQPRTPSPYPDNCHLAIPPA